jgi:cytosine/uracil/thiamine/allantoin permease
MFGTIASFSWFVGAGLSGALYWATARRAERAPDAMRGA